MRRDLRTIRVVIVEVVRDQGWIWRRQDSHVPAEPIATAATAEAEASPASGLHSTDVSADYLFTFDLPRSRRRSVLTSFFAAISSRRMSFRTSRRRVKSDFMASSWSKNVWRRSNRARRCARSALPSFGMAVKLFRKKRKASHNTFTNNRGFAPCLLSSP